jgi:hypothetical protein
VSARRLTLVVRHNKIKSERRIIMPHGAKLASKCFAENLADYVNLRTEGEKNNLYNGLRALAEEVEAISLKLHVVDGKLDLIIQGLSHSH